MRQSCNYMPPDLPDLGPLARLDDTGARLPTLAHWTVADRGPAPGGGEVLGRCSGLVRAAVPGAGDHATVAVGAGPAKMAADRVPAVGGRDHPISRSCC